MSYQTQPVRLVGGRLCLDFLNTADWSADGSIAHEKLLTKNDLAIWCRKVGLTEKVCRSLPDSAGRIQEFRAQLRGIFLAVIQNEEPKSKDMAALNKVLHVRKPFNSLVMSRGIIAFNHAMSLEQIVGHSAVSVLTVKREIRRVRQCPPENCGWLFLDESRNKRRLWCSMEICGNRAKARRHYERNSDTGL